MAKIFALRRNSTDALRLRKDAILRVLVCPSSAIRASVVEHFGTCGRPSCLCHRGHKHGPYYYLTQCIAKGHVRKVLLKTPAAQRAARECVSVFNQFYDALEELSQINAELFRRGEPLDYSSE